MVDLVRNNPSGRQIEHRYALRSRPVQPYISTVTVGELLGLARLLRWGAPKLTALQALLNQCVQWPAGDRGVIEAYAELFHEMRKRKRTMGQNDLWIAAKAAGAVLLTGDLDFGWMHPDLIRVEYVPRNP
jgi:predicted nucleic acid-binding protein